MINTEQLEAIRNKFHQNACDFEFCIGYILQATRHGSTSYAVDDGIVISTKKPGADNPVVVVCLGANREQKIFEIAKELFDRNSLILLILFLDHYAQNVIVSSKNMRSMFADGKTLV